ncbi:hypothetical protein EHM69_10525 [candidate division KSB1 bacterium]|nr:MAG: hypothetical protein EHM69_10525 [candidate division KSB1 bacterium]
MNLVLYKEAVERLGVTNEEVFKRDTKRLGCFYQRSGIIKIDVDKFQSAMDAEFEMAAKDVSAPKARKRSAGSDLGIVMARLSQDEKRRKAKLQKIADVKEAMVATKTAYERGKLQRELKKLENELKLQDERHIADEQRRDEILNSEDSN